MFKGPREVCCGKNVSWEGRRASGSKDQWEIGGGGIIE